MKFIFSKLTMIFIFVLLCAGFAFAQVETETGIELYEKGEYEKAVESLTKRVEADKNDGETWRFLGMAYAHLNRAKEARKAFGRARDFKDEDLKKNYDMPLKLISKRLPKYTDAARQNNVTGKIIVAVEYGADGAIRYVVPIIGLPDGLTENAIKAASEIKFEPAQRGGKAVPVIAFVEYSFAIY